MKRRALFFAAGSLLLALGGIALLCRSKEPVYHGKNIPQWLFQYASKKDMADRDEALDALRAMPDETARYLISRNLNPSGLHFLTNQNWMRLVKGLPSALGSRLYAPEYDRDNTMEIFDLKPSAGTVLPLLKDTLSQTNTQHYHFALWVLGSVGEDREKVLPHLVRAAESKNQLTRVLAIQSLGNLRMPSLEAEPALIAALQDPANRFRAMRALRFLGPSGSNAVPALQSWLDSTNRQEALWAAASLANIAPELKTLDAIVDHETNFDAVALGALSELGPQGLPALPMLLRTLREKPAVWERLGASSQPLQGSWNWILQTIQRMDPNNREVIPILLERLPSSRGTDRANIAAWLIRFEPGEPHGLKLLADCAADPQNPSRHFAIGEIAAAGPSAKAAAPVLRSALHDPDEHIRKALRRALQKIEPN